MQVNSPDTTSLTPENNKYIDSILNQLESLDAPKYKDKSWRFSKIEKYLPSSWDAGAIDITFSGGTSDIQLQKLENWNLIPQQDDALGLINNLYSQKYVLNIPDNTSVTLPLKIDLLFKEQAYSSLVINVGKNSKVSVLQSISASATDLEWQSHSTYINCAENANISLAQVCDDNIRLYTHTGAQLKSGAQLHLHQTSLKAIFQRHNFDIQINGENAHADVDGCFIITQNDHADHYGTISHNHAHTTSSQLYKGMASDEGHGIFSGIIEIARDAQKVDAHQLSKNLLLSKKAHIHAEPQLAVYADDVKCAHGATVGQLSDEELFYLESRCISESRAKEILCHAFCLDSTHNLDESIAAPVQQKIISSVKEIVKSE